MVVKFHSSARADYEAWQTRLGEPPTGNPGVARAHAEELIRQFQETNGLPGAAHFYPELDPPSWVWRFSADTWVRFVRREARAGLWGGRVVEVVILGVAVRPPS